MNERAIELVLRIGRALQNLQTPAHRLEDTLQEASTRLTLQASFFSTPTSLFCAFGPLGRQSVRMLRIQAGGEVDLERMWALDRLATHLEPSEAGLDAAEEALERLEKPSRRSGGLDVLTFVVISASVARFLGGDGLQMLVAGGLGALTGTLALSLTRSPTGGRMFELVAAFSVTALGSLLGWLGWVDRASVAIIAGLIVLLPGMTLTVAMSELATRNLASGSARLTAALMALGQLTFGTALGSKLVGLLGPGVEAEQALPLPAWVVHPCLLATSVGLVVLFRVPLGFTGWVAGAVHLAFWSARWSAEPLGPELAGFLSAFLVCVLGNAFARFRKAPASIVLLPGILLLVPGSVGYRSFLSFFDQDPLAGLGGAVQMATITAGIVSGLLLASAVFPPRRTL
ncbi:MAG: threonine/serine exporter family protein [Myxococcota bacterium]